MNERDRVVIMTGGFAGETGAVTETSGGLAKVAVDGAGVEVLVDVDDLRAIAPAPQP